MSVIMVDHEDPNPVSLDDFRALTATRGMKLEPEDEASYFELLRAAEKCIKYVHNLPEYVEPRLEPDMPTPRTYTQPPNGSPENPLGGWSHRSHIESSRPLSNELLKARTVAAKDNVLVAGVPLTLGTAASHLSNDGKYPVSKIDAPVIQRVLESGAVFKGTAMCENYCMSALSFTSAAGAIANPWLRTGPKGEKYAYACGGSSSGCGNLVAVNVVKKLRQQKGASPEELDRELGEGVDFALGGDQGGSIRLPAAYSGIYGLKPTHGLVPYTGIASLHPLIDHCGPMAGSVRDTALLLSVLAGYDGMDPRMTPETPLRANVPQYHDLLDREIAARTTSGTWTPTQAGQGLKIGVVREGWDVPTISPEVDAITRAATQRFASLGATVGEISIPLHKLGPAIWTAATRAQMIDNFTNTNALPLLSHTLPDLNPPAPDQAWYENMNRHNPAAVNVFFAGAYLSSAADKFPAAIRNKAMTHVAQLRAAYDDALATYDVLIVPAAPTVAMQRDERWFEGGVMGHLDLALGNNMNTGGFNVTGHPGLVMPVGWGAPREEGVQGKLPVAMQIVGRRFGEEKMFLAAAAWEVGGRAYDEW
ncbi:amidase signature domain-containing protein [Xylariomycetidae sp. FL2044]|nr:amidase signature domain-containing protein [Xylariomycetidae sp. FL2044]KAH9885638.1 amidase signature domain-containing protein [Xylariomycetidae sp. FL2044]